MEYFYAIRRTVAGDAEIMQSVEKANNLYQTMQQSRFVDDAININSVMWRPAKVERQKAKYAGDAASCTPFDNQLCGAVVGCPTAHVATR